MNCCTDKGAFVCLAESSTLQTSDWNGEWGRIHKLRGAPRNAAYWDMKARTFDSDTVLSDYHSAFMASADVHPGESVFDMGCGTGSLCVEYAKAGHEVLGADFSAGMLAEALRRTRRRNLQTVRFEQMSWDCDWEAHGVLPNSFDVAIASRSLATADMAGALAKLSTVARRRCFITLSIGGAPRIDPRILDACAIPDFKIRDFQYALTMLINAEYLPNLSYLTSTRIDSFDSFEDAVRVYRSSLGELTADQSARLYEWLRGELVPNDDVGRPDGFGGTQKALRLARPRTFHWALISWDV